MKFLADLLLLCLLLLATVGIKAQNNIFNNPATSFDTIIHYFGEAYHLSLKINDAYEYDYETKNGVLAIHRLRDNQIIINDSVDCMTPWVQFRDYNGDRIPDILIYRAHGARANTSYHLYVADSKNKTFHLIEEFGELPNMEIDSNHIITCTALSGRVEVSFYRINPNYELVQLGRTIEIDIGEEEGQKEVKAEYQKILAVIKNR
jgi:hypothetical protein